MDPGRRWKATSSKGPGEKRAPRWRQLLSWCGCGSAGVGGAGSGGGGGRDWSDLPGPALFCALKCMARGGCLGDLRAFSQVCRAWRSASFSCTGRELSVASYLPPLLLSYTSIHRSPSPNQPFLGIQSFPNRGYHRRKVAQMPAPLLADEVQIVGYSCGYMVVICHQKVQGDAPYRYRIFLVDPLADSREATTHIELPGGPSHVHRALLTAPPASGSDCVVVITGYNSVQYCRPLAGAGEDGDVAAWEDVLLPPELYFFGTHSVAIGGKVYMLLPTGYVLVIGGFSPTGPPSVAHIEVKGLSHHVPTFPEFLLPALVTELNGEMLLVHDGDCVVGRRDIIGHRGHFLVYRLDLSRRQWVRVSSLGDYSLFSRICDPGSCIASDVTKWGGTRNCIYSLERDEWGCNKTLWIYHIRDGRVERLPTPVVQPRFYSDTIWVLPNLNPCH